MTTSPTMTIDDPQVATALVRITPATYGRRGLGAEIAYTIARSPLGRLLVAATPAGVCAVRIGDNDSELAADLHHEFSAATAITRDNALIAPLVAEVVEAAGGRPPADSLPLDVRATEFQRAVWEELRCIPPGTTRTYGEIASAVGHPNAARAVGRACATNPVAIAVPCHRAVGSDGALTGYAYGLERKQKLLVSERLMTAI